jgi:hypothetical protein
MVRFRRIIEVAPRKSVTFLRLSVAVSRSLLPSYLAGRGRRSHVSATAAVQVLPGLTFSKIIHIAIARVLDCSGTPVAGEMGNTWLHIVGG